MKSIHPRVIALVTALFAAAPAAAYAEAPAAAKAEALPTARTEGLSFSVDGDALVLKEQSSGKISRLHVIAAAVYSLSDGKTSPAAMRDKLVELTGYVGSDELVFAALDALADAKLLQARVTPPGTSPLELVVAPDGTLGSELVTAASAEAQKAAGANAEETRKKNLANEAAAKSTNRARFKSEENAKQADKSVNELATARKQARKVRDERLLKRDVAHKEDAKVKGEAARKDDAMKAYEGAHTAAKAAASGEAIRRRKLEMEKKQQHESAEKK
jgi:hypothetical protein